MRGKLVQKAILFKVAHVANLYSRSEKTTYFQNASICWYLPKQLQIGLTIWSQLNNVTRFVKSKLISETAECGRAMRWRHIWGTPFGRAKTNMASDDGSTTFSDKSTAESNDSGNVAVCTVVLPVQEIFSHFFVCFEAVSSFDILPPNKLPFQSHSGDR